MDPEALEHTFNVTRSFDFFRPLADFSNDAASVFSGRRRKYRPVSSQLNIWSGQSFSIETDLANDETNSSAAESLACKRLLYF